MWQGWLARPFAHSCCGCLSSECSRSTVLPVGRLAVVLLGWCVLRCPRISKHGPVSSCARFSLQSGACDAGTRLGPVLWFLTVFAGASCPGSARVTWQRFVPARCSERHRQKARGPRRVDQLPPDWRFWGDSIMPYCSDLPKAVAGESFHGKRRHHGEGLCADPWVDSAPLPQGDGSSLFLRVTRNFLRCPRSKQSSPALFSVEHAY